jgi:DNA polymerase (family 10)
MDNRTVAQRLTAHARELDREQGNVYRVQAYRRAAETILGLDEPVGSIVAARGRQGLAALPGIGTHLAYTIERLVRTGEFRTITAETVPPQKRVSRLPGVGPVLTELLRERLAITTIEELKAADRDGRLEQLGLPGKRLQRLRQTLAQEHTAVPLSPRRGRV